MGIKLYKLVEDMNTSERDIYMAFLGNGESTSVFHIYKCAYMCVRDLFLKN